MKSPPLPYSALVVDDSPHMRILLMRLLQRSGIASVESAVNGAEGVERYKASKPDLVFLDAIMPEKDGLAALREIKSIDPESIVIMTTSLSEREKVLQFKDAGANYYLLKPFEDDKFMETLGKVITILAQRTKKGQ
jgi:two-component system, chemotaxis family, chemotaxis protein CheY